MTCKQRLYSPDCGMRIVAPSKAIGVGQMSMRLKAAPGPGVVTSFYLSNNGGMFSDSKPWNEIDFEIFGKMASPNNSVIWTNLFTGLQVEHNQVIHVPFDVTADFHTYTFDLSPTAIKYMVDGVVYRILDISAWEDAKNSIQSSNLRSYISVWGKTVADPQVGCGPFVNLQGKLDDNKGPFPLYARFRAEWNPDPPRTTTVPPPKSCGPMDQDVDYVVSGVSGSWTKIVDKVHSAGDCCKHCQSESECQSYTWAQFKSQCWLKNGLPTGKKKNMGVVSGLPHHSKLETMTTTSTTLPAPKSCGPREENVDYVTMGGQADWFTMVDVASVDDCCTQCQAQSLCKSYTWVADAKESGLDKGQCWLKSRLPDKKPAKKGVVSGLPWPKKRTDLKEAGTTSSVPARHTAPNKTSTASPVLHHPGSCTTHEKDIDYLVKATWIKLIDRLPSVGFCCQHCFEDSQCQSYTWVASAETVQGTQSQCWLKDGLPYRKSAKAGVVSGLSPRNHKHHMVSIAPAKLHPPGSCGPQEKDIDYVVNASWFKQVESIHSPDACCAQCQAEAECKSYSWVKGAQISGKFMDQCWLKNGLPDKKQKNLGVVSGLPWAGASSKKVDTLQSCGPQDKDIDYVVTKSWFKKMDHVPSASDCCAKCNAEAKCKSYTWVEDAKLPTGNPGQCWLKGKLPSQKALKAGVVSGLPGPKADKSKDGTLLEMFATRPDTPETFATPRCIGFSVAALATLGSATAAVLVSRRLRSTEESKYHTLKQPATEAALLSSCASEPEKV
eukprot:CAMPEP_0172674124 /NCGR_PEP_ID=MMETSP1074-20121228/12567_1 /TAXON_ID=2916 /ORGANISM="Ceratium fusus, Strain PA161109" /LENGTH=778 /DNA_ID=CAMNT_0013491513 /DNA_START=162 /DNA_END=2498 /DNA_ORIENTATION=-